MGQYSVSIQNGEKNLFQKSTAKFKKRTRNQEEEKSPKGLPLFYTYIHAQHEQATEAREKSVQDKSTYQC
jgi:hypothetical protein